MSKTLVIILSELSDCKLAFDSFKKNVFDELNADLCLCSGVKTDEKYSDNPFYKLAKYKFLYEMPDDFRDAFEYAYNIISKDNPKYERFNSKNALFGRINVNETSSDNNNIRFYGTYQDINNFDDFSDDEIIIHKSSLEDSQWRSKVYGIKKSYNTDLHHQINMVTYKKNIHWSEFLKIKGEFLGGIKNDQNQHLGNGSKYIFFQWFLLKNIIENNLTDKYDKFIITQCDFVYQLPYPNVSYMDENYIWFPNSEQYGGYTHKHVVLSKKYIKKFLTILNDFVTKSNNYFLQMKNSNFWNLQKLIRLSLEQNNLIYIVKEFPFIMYSISEAKDVPFINYKINSRSEYEKSNYYKEEFEKSGLTVHNFYKNHIFKYTTSTEIVAITVCVNYHDILYHIIDQNFKFLNSWYIVTSPEDISTINLIKNKNLPNIKVLIYNDFYTNARFNKGGAIRFAQDYVDNNHNSQTVIILDADIYLPHNFLVKIPNYIQDNTIYGVYERRDYWSLDEFLNNENGHEYVASQHIVGFFQLYKQGWHKYDDYSFNCSSCDDGFRNKFEHRANLDLCVKHLGMEGVNWDGRKTQFGFFFEPE
jgi:hypothetical protein